MSMNDKERIDLVNRVYREMTHYKELANYYTRKNLHVSYLRAKEKNEQQQVFDLYGKDERYWYYYPFHLKICTRFFGISMIR